MLVAGIQQVQESDSRVENGCVIDVCGEREIVKVGLKHGFLELGDGGLAAEEGRAGGEVGVQGRETLSGLCGILGGSSDVGGSDEPLLDLGLLRLGVLRRWSTACSCILPCIWDVPQREDKRWWKACEGRRQRPGSAGMSC